MLRGALILYLLFSPLFADEIQRVHAIVDDITKLRKEYEGCTKELSARRSLEDENAKLRARIAELEKAVKADKILLKTKENSKNNQIIKKEECVEDDGFPELMMKNDTLVVFEPSAFRLSEEAFVYDGVRGRELEKWEKGTSFTSNAKKGEWIKITGYFVERKWRSAKDEMWVRSKSAIKRHK